MSKMGRGLQEKDLFQHEPVILRGPFNLVDARENYYSVICMYIMDNL